jgi:hypothetical protein
MKTREKDIEEAALQIYIKRMPSYNLTHARLSHQSAMLESIELAEKFYELIDIVKLEKDTNEKS